MSMGRQIAVVSGKGGVGKTTIAGGIAGTLAAMGRCVLLVDGDVGLGNLDLMLGIEGEAVHDLLEVLDGHCPLRSAVLRISREHPLWYLPLALSIRADFSNLCRLPEALETLREKFDDLIVDCPAGLGETVRCLMVVVDLAVVVTTPDLVAVRDARRTMQMLAQMDCDARLVINRIRPSLMQQGGAPDVDDIIDGVGAQLLGLVPEDALVTPLQNAGVPVIFQTASPAAAQIRDVARRLEGENRPLRFP